MKSIFLFGDGSYHPMHQLCGTGWAVYDKETNKDLITGSAVFEAPDKHGILFSELMAIRKGMETVKEMVGNSELAELIIVIDNDTVARLLRQEQTLEEFEEEVEGILMECPENTEIMAVNRADNEFTHHLSRASVEQKLLKQRMQNGVGDDWLEPVGYNSI